MGLRASASWKNRESRDLLLELMTKEFGEIYFPLGLPGISYVTFQNQSAKSDVMGTQTMNRAVRMVQPYNSLFIVTCGHEELSTNLQS